MSDESFLRSHPELGSAASREFRVFVSSTFREMQEERDYLVKFIFPQLRKLCSARGVTWTEVDLRWGITDEDAAESRVLPVCLAEVERCAPYFIGLLGERYGWIPQDIGPDVLRNHSWVGTYRDRSVTELEIIQGLVYGRSDGVGGHIYFRAFDPGRQRDGRVWPAGDVESGDAVAKLEQLKGRIRAAYSRGECSLRDGFRDPEELGSWILEDFTRLIDSRFPAQGYAGWPRQNTEDHEYLQRRLTDVYIPRLRYFERLDAHAFGDGPPLVVLGKSGLGKSALLVNWISRFRRMHPGQSVLSYFVGRTSNITTLGQMLREIMLQLKDSYGIHDEIPFELSEVRAAFPRFLNLATQHERFVLVIDAVNQLDGADDLTWIPTQIGPNVRLVISSTPGGAIDAVDRSWERLTVEPLDTAERRALVTAFLARHSHALDRERLERIVGSDQSAIPLFTWSMLDELRQVGVHERLDELIERYLRAPDTAALFELIIERWEDDFGGDMVGATLSAMACSTKGMSQSELLDILGMDGLPFPPAHWVPFHLAAEAFLSVRSGLFGFLHQGLLDAVRRRLLPTPERERDMHARLGDYFEAQVSFLDGSRKDEARSFPNRRKAEELAQQRLRAGDRQAVGRTLSDLDYIELKLAAGLGHELIAEYREADAAFGLDGDIASFSRFVSRNLSQLVRDPEVTFQTAANEPVESVVADRAERRWRGGKERRLWLCHLNKDVVEPPFGLAYDGHLTPGSGGGGSSNWVTACRYSPDGRWIASTDYVGAVHVRDAETGVVRSMFSMTGESVFDCAWAPDSRLLLVVSRGLPTIWDALTGDRIATLDDPAATGAVSCDWSSDGEQIVTGGGRFDYLIGEYQKRLILWRTSDWTAERTLGGHDNQVSCVRFGSENRTLVSGDGGALVVWDRRSGEERARRTCSGVTALVCVPDSSTTAWTEWTEVTRSLSGTVTLARNGIGDVVWSASVPSPTCVSMSVDGRCLAVGSRDHKLYVFDAAGGTLKHVLEGHGSWLEACDSSPKRSIFATGSRDCTVRTWSVPLTGLTTRTGVIQHDQEVRCGAFSEDGSLFVSGSESDLHGAPAGSLELWDAQTGAHRATLLSKEESVESCAFLDEDRVLVSTGGHEILRRPALLEVNLRSLTVSTRLKGHLPVWKIDRGRRLLFVPAYGSARRARIISLDGWDRKATEGRADCVISESAGLVATADDAGRVILHSLDRNSWTRAGAAPRWKATWRRPSPVRLEPALDTGIDSLASSWDMRYVAALSRGHLDRGGMERELLCWELSTGAVRLRLSGGDLRAPTFSDDAFIVTRNGVVLVFELPTFRPRGELHGHRYHVTGSVAIPRSPWVATVSLDKSLRLWNVATMMLERLFPLRSRGLFVSISPTEPTLAAGDELGIVYLLAIRTM